MDALIVSVPYEDFLSALELCLQQPDHRIFPPHEKLRDFAFTGLVTPQVHADPVPVSLYLVQERDPILNESKAFAVLRTEQGNETILLRESRRLNGWLRAHGIPALFRIDPIYGPILGSAQETVQVVTAAPPPYILMVMVLTDKPQHPELALQDYVPKEHRGRYLELFERYNRVPPTSLRLRSLDLSGIFRRKSEPCLMPYRTWPYSLLKDLSQTLALRHLWRDLHISLIYTEVQEEDLQNLPFPEKSLSLYPTQPCRFFHNIEDLLRQDGI